MLTRANKGVGGARRGVGEAIASRRRMGLVPRASMVGEERWRRHMRQSAMADLRT